MTLQLRECLLRPLLTLANPAALPLLQDLVAGRAVERGAVLVRVGPVAPEHAVGARAVDAGPRRVRPPVGDDHAGVEALGAARRAAKALGRVGGPGVGAVEGRALGLAADDLTALKKINP